MADVISCGNEPFVLDLYHDGPNGVKVTNAQYVKARETIEKLKNALQHLDMHHQDEGDVVTIPTNEFESAVVQEALSLCWSITA